MVFRCRFFLRALCAFCALCATVFFLSCCEGGLSRAWPHGDRIAVMNWNAQCFFDATESGAEFAEYRGRDSDWSPERYSERLDRLREAILLVGSRAGYGGDRGPDIVVLEEIESESVIRDLCNRMPRNAGYAHAAFVQPGEGCSFGNAVLSRYPVLSVSAHSVGATDENLRPILEVSLDVRGKELVVFASHWKSKGGSGVARKDEESPFSDIRALQEEVLAERIRQLEYAKPDAYWIACGDFNQKPEEFRAMSAYQNAWSGNVPAGADSGGVDSVGEKGIPDGSYWYDGEWERIDHFFYPSGDRPSAPSSIRPIAFQPIAMRPFVDEAGHPDGYKLFSGKGYSDHLPLLLILERGD